MAKRKHPAPLYVMLTVEERNLVDSLAKRDDVKIRELVMRAVRQYAGRESTSIEQRVAALEAALFGGGR